MIDQKIIDITDDFDDFLKKVIANYEVSYAGLVGIIMARMVVLAQVSGGEEIMLKMIPHMQKTLITGMNSDGYH
jgi:hypothetical protein